MSNKNNETFGRRIARMRLQHGMTQERLANIANVSAQAVSKWENDQSYPDIMLLPLLASTFDVTIDELLGAEVEAPAQVATPVLTEEPATQPEPVVVPTTPESEDEAPFKIEAMPEYEPTPEPEDDCDQPSSRIRIHVMRQGKDAVNLAIPLAAARIVSNVLEYLPDRIIDGVDLKSLTYATQSAEKGTLVDVDDGGDHVVISLE